MSFVPLNLTTGPLKFYDGACYAYGVVGERGQNRTAKFALIESITRLFRRLIRFRKFIFGGAGERDSTKHVQLVKRGDIFDSLAS